MFIVGKRGRHRTSGSALFLAVTATNDKERENRSSRVRWTITPLLQVNQAVRIARADERIAMAKAGMSGSRNAGDSEIQATYFRLLIAQRWLTSAESKLRVPGTARSMPRPPSNWSAHPVRSRSCWRPTSLIAKHLPV